MTAIELRPGRAAPAALAIAVSLCAAAVPAAPAQGAGKAAPARASVLGGSPASLREFPFAVAVVRRGAELPDGHVCGASQVAPDAVVTAAHCVGGRPLDLVAGRERLSATSGVRLPVVETDVHPLFTRDGTHDVAVLRTARPLPGTPIALARPGDDLRAPGSRARVAGWGLVSRLPDRASDMLIAAAVTVRSSATCAAAHPELFDPDAMLCANGAEADRAADACRGDSGGPLATEAYPPTLVGIVSGGTGRCGDPDSPTVYTDAAAVRDFVARLIARPVNPDPPAGWQPSTGRSPGVAVSCRGRDCRVRIAVPTHLQAIDRVSLRIRRTRHACLGNERCRSYDRRVFAARVGSARWTTRIRVPAGVVRITATALGRSGAVVGAPASVRVVVAP